jgi:glycosyltransferase involved in cell wall biosynthesis
MPKYSFVVPIYGDGCLAEDYCLALQRQMLAIVGEKDLAAEIELIFVNDGSPNDSQRYLEDMSRRFSWVRVIELSRNFGQHIAISCGYQFARGQFIGMMDVDMQDPPDQIPLLLAPLIEDKCDITIGLRAQREERWSERITSYAFHSLLNWLTGARSPINIATMRMVNRRFLNAYNQLTERSTYIPGLQNWLGFRHAHIPIRHQKRERGKSSYTFFKRLRLATESIISFSDLPLRLAAAAGSVIAGLGLILALVLIIDRLYLGTVAPGYASTIVVVIFLGGTNLMFLGLIGVYVGRILGEVQGRPRFIIKSFLGSPPLAHADKIQASSASSE